jgi:3-hydroxybutyryl-CoA dehydrogenase
MTYAIVQHGESRSFPIGDDFLEGATTEEKASVILHLGRQTDVHSSVISDARPAAVLIELGIECLGVHTGESAGREGSHVLGFARYRNGDDPPSNLIELVRQPATPDAALEAAREVFEHAGFVVAVCADQAGRIIDRLVRPKYNAALRFLDEGLATAEDMDLTCRLGLSYPDGPIERVERGGLAHHYDVTKALFEVYGGPGFAPARRATVAAQRRDR